MRKGLTYDRLSRFCRIGRTRVRPGPGSQYAIRLTPEQEARLHHLSPGSLAPCATVQRARIVLLAQPHPQWQKAASAQPLKCPVNTVKRWRQRWQARTAVSDAPRTGPRRSPCRRRGHSPSVAMSSPRFRRVTG
jgi:hypothetical protein